MMSPERRPEPPFAPAGPRFDSRTGQRLRDDERADGESGARPRPGSRLGRVVALIIAMLAFAGCVGWLVVDATVSRRTPFVPDAAIPVLVVVRFVIAIGAIIGALLGSIVLNRRPVAGFVLGGSLAFTIGQTAWNVLIPWHAMPWQILIAPTVLSVLAVVVSLGRRLPGFTEAGLSTATSPQRRANRRGWLVSVPNMLLGLIAVLFVAGCLIIATLHALQIRGSGPVTTRSMDVAPFSAVSMPGMGELELVPGSRPNVTISGDRNIVAGIQARVVDGQLLMTFDARRGASIRLHEPLHIRVTAPSVGTIFLNGDSSLREDTTFSAPAMRLSVEDAAQVPGLTLTGGSLSLVMTNTASVRLAGRVDALDTDLSDAASLDATDLRAAAVQTHVRDDATARVMAVMSLAYTQAGNGTLRYQATPATHIGGSADREGNVIAERDAPVPSSRSGVVRPGSFRPGTTRRVAQDMDPADYTLQVD